MPVVLLLFLFVVAPVWAGSVERRIQALEEIQRANAEELARLKGEQADLRNEAIAARDAIPSFTYRPGRGLQIRGADRSWEMTLSGIFDGRISFFPDAGKAVDDSSGPSQFALRLRRLRLGFDFAWEDGLYSAGFTPVWEGAPSARFLEGGFSIDFSKFSPFYPRLDIVSVRPMFNRQGSLFSSSGGTSQERPLIENSIISSGSTEGVGLFWSNLPVGVGRIRNLDLVATPGQQFNSKTGVSPIDQKGFMLGYRMQPFSELKGSLLQGLEIGVGYLFDEVDDFRSSRSHDISTTTRTNQVRVFRADARGRRHWMAPNLGWNHGPYRLGFSWDYLKSERDFSGKAGLGKLDDMVLREITARAGMFVWGPRGFMSGDERRGWMLAYNYFRPDFDAGRDFAERNRFSSMRRYHITQHAIMLKWFQAANRIYSIQYNILDFSKMEGGGDAADARKRLGIRSGGGTSQDITLGIRWDF